MKERIYKGCERIVEAKKFNNLKEMVENTKAEYSDEIAFRFKNDETKEITTMLYKDYVEEIEAFGTALISIGLKDKRIGLISENRYEWEASYLAVTTGVGIIVPLDKSLPDNEILSLIERSEIEALIYSSKYDEIMKQAKDNKIGKVKFFISMDSSEKKEGMYSFKEQVQLGKDLIKNGARSYLDAEIDNEKMAIMLFTSGTTSQSKAVMLSQTNICTNIYDISSVFDITSDDTFLSFLPLHHVFECTVGFLYPFSKGASIGFCKGIRHIAENIKDYEVSAMISVPILYDAMYKKLMQAVEKHIRIMKKKPIVLIDYLNIQKQV